MLTVVLNLMLLFVKTSDKGGEGKHVPATARKDLLNGFFLNRWQSQNYKPNNKSVSGCEVLHKFFMFHNVTNSQKNIKVHYTALD